MDPRRLEAFDLSFYALRKDGDYASASLWNGTRVHGQLRRRQFAVADARGARLEDCSFLLERK